MSSVEQFIKSPNLTGLPTGDLSDRDATLLGLWIERGADDRQPTVAVTWWSEEREVGQDLVDFLISRQILLRSAGVAIEQIAAGVPVAEGVSFFTNQGQAILDTRSQDPVQLRGAQVGGSVPTAAATPTKGRKSRLGRRSGSTSHRLPSTRRPTQTPDHPGELLDVRFPSIGSQLGRCLLIESIDETSGTHTYRALHRTLGACVLVQMVPEQVFRRDANLSSAFAEHARRLVEHNHPHVQRVWEFDHCEGFTYLVVEQIEGLSLRELTLNCGRIQPDKLLKYLTQAAEGMEFAAGMRVPHSDLKADRFMLTRDGILKVAGFGMEPFRRVMIGMGIAIDHAPENSSRPASAHDIRSDIRSLGTAFFHALTGQPPHNSRSVHMALARFEPRILELFTGMLTESAGEGFSDYRELRLALGEQEADMLARAAAEKWPSEPRGPAAAQREAWQLLLQRYGGS